MSDEAEAILYLKGRWHDTLKNVESSRLVEECCRSRRECEPEGSTLRAKPVVLYSCGVECVCLDPLVGRRAGLYVL